MEEELGLRERKKRATWSLLMTTALDMFEERGFDNVSVAEIAAKAGVSKATVFNYFPSKEDLVVAGAKAHTHEPAELVRGRAKGETPHSVMRDYFLRALKRQEPMAGLCDQPIVLQVQRIVRTNPGLNLRLMYYRRQSAALLAEQLIEEGGSALTSNLVASELLHVQHILAQGNLIRIYAGESPESIYPDAVAAAEHAFSLLEHGIGGFMRRETEPPATSDVAFNCDADHCVEYVTADDMRREGERVQREADEAAPGKSTGRDRP